jgi:PKD repeat protein
LPPFELHTARRIPLRLLAGSLRALLLAAFVAAAPAARGDQTPASCTPERLFTLAGGSIESVWIDRATPGRRLAYLSGQTGVVVLDVTDPAKVAVDALVVPGSRARAARADGGRIYVAAEEAGLLVFESTVPGNPSPRGRWDSPGFALALAVDGFVVWVADTTGGLAAVDVSDPDFPVLLGTYESTSSIVDVAVVGGRAYVAAGAAGLEILDVSDPAHPVRRGSAAVPFYASAVAVDGSVAWVADGLGIRAFDVSDPTTPFPLGSIDLPGQSAALALAGGRAWVGSGPAGLHVVNVSNPWAPLLESSLETPGSVVGVDVVEGIVALADLEGGLHLVDAKNPAAPTLISTYRGPAVAAASRIAGSTLHCAAGSEGLLLHDLSNPEAPAFLSALPLQGTVASVLPDGWRDLVANIDRGLQIVDVTDPLHPLLVSTFPTAGECWDIAVDRSIAWVADGTAGLRSVDVSNPTSPFLLGSVPVGGPARSVELSGSLAIVAAGSGGVAVVDRTDPRKPVLLGRWDPDSEVREIRVSGQTVYAAAGGMGVVALSIAQPASPRFVGSLNTPGSASGLAFDGTDVFVADGQGGIRIVDFSVPSDPVFKGSLVVPGNSVSLSLSGSIAFLSATEGGLAILDVGACLAAPPRPVASFTFSPTTPCEGSAVSFQDTSTGEPEQWSWEFGDGTISSEATPSHVFAAAGSWPVSLTVRNSAGSSAVTRTVDVHRIPPAPEPLSPPDGAVSLVASAVELDWTVHPESNGARVRVWRGTSCGQLLGSWATASPPFRPPSLPSGEWLSWNVEPSGKCGAGPASPCRSFGTLPLSGFSVSPRPACRNQTVSLDDRSIGSAITSWHWDFGDGSTSEERSPRHAWSATGRFLVTLTVSGATGQGTSSQTVDVVDLPSVSFSFSPSPSPAGEPVQFLDGSQGNPYSWSWSFGDGGSSTEENPVHAFVAPGLYTVTLAARNSCGTAFGSALVPVGLAPSARFEIAPTIACVGEEIGFLDRSGGDPTRWRWQFGDGATLDGGPRPIHAYDRPGGFLVELAASNDWGESRFRRTVIVMGDPAPSIATSPPPARAGAPFLLADGSSGALRRRWTFEDGSSSEEPDNWHVFADPGDALVRLDASNGCGTGSTSLVVPVLAAEPPAAAPARIAVDAVVGAPLRFEDRSSGTVVSRRWLFGDGEGSSEADPVHVYTRSGTFVPELEVSGPAGESRRNGETVTVRGVVTPEPIDFLFVPTDPRVGDAVAFWADLPGGADEATWESDDGWNGDGDTVVHVFLEPGDHEVRLSSGGAMARRTVTVASWARSVDFDFTPPAPTTGRRVVLRGLLPADATRWEWDFGDGGSGEGGVADHTWTSPGSYRVRATATTSGGERRTAERVVTLRPNPGDPPVHQRLAFPLSEGGRTDLSLFNPASIDRTFRWRFVADGEAASSDDWRDGALPPFASVASERLLEGLFAIAPGTGGRLDLELPVDDQPSLHLAAQGRSGAPSRAPIVEIARQGPADATGSGQLLGLRLGTSLEPYVILRSTLPDPVLATFVVRSGAGAELGRASRVLPADGSLRLRLVDAIPELGSLEGEIAVSLVAPAGVSISGGFVDLASGDEESVPSARPTRRAFFPGARRTTSAGGFAELTELVLANPGAKGITVRLSLRSGSATMTAFETLAAGALVRWEDLLGSGPFGIRDGSGTLELEGVEPGATFEAFARLRRDEGGAGSVGSALPMVSSASAATSERLDRSLFAAGLRRREGAGGFESFDLLLSSIGGDDALVDLRFRDEAGGLLLVRGGIVIPPSRTVRFVDPLSPLGTVSGASVEVLVRSGEIAGAALLHEPIRRDFAFRALR